MKTIGVCAAFRAGEEITAFIANAGHPISFVATCDRDDSEYEAKIAAICEKKNIDVIRGVDANSPAFIEVVRSRAIDIMILAWWPTILRRDAIQAARIGWLNLHPSLLPSGRGKHGYYWAIVESTPFGVSLHFIDDGIDSGSVLFQKEIPVDITDTGETLYKRSFEQSIALFRDSYEQIVSGDLVLKRQLDSDATFHWGKEIDEHSRVDLDREYRAIDLINILRGRTFWQGDSAYFVRDGKKYLIRVKIEEADSDIKRGH